MGLIFANANKDIMENQCQNTINNNIYGVDEQEKKEILLWYYENHPITLSEFNSFVSDIIKARSMTIGEIVKRYTLSR